MTLINQSSTITRITNRLDGGKVLGVRSGMWLYMKVPLSPIAAAKNDKARRGDRQNVCKTSPGD